MSREIDEGFLGNYGKKEPPSFFKRFAIAALIFLGVVAGCFALLLFVLHPTT